MSRKLIDPGVDSGGESEESEDEDYALPFFVDNPVLTNTILLLAYVIFGIVVLCASGKRQPATAFYMITQIITTIGYGDITVESATMKVFMTLYVLFGTLLIANIANDFFNKILERADSALERNLEKATAQLNDDLDTVAEVEKRYGGICDLLVPFLIYVLFIAIWVAFYSTWEACTCSYGPTAVDGCIEGKLCSSTGGYQVSVLDATYGAVITFSTVGFGDMTPKTMTGQILGSFLMIMGVLAFGNLVAAVSVQIDKSKQRRKEEKRRFSRQAFREIDTDNRGYLTKHQFINYMLVRQGIVGEKSVKKFTELFDALDANPKDGHLSFQEIASVDLG